jgi:hypothetical protein
MIKLIIGAACIGGAVNDFMHCHYGFATFELIVGVGVLCVVLWDVTE